MIGSPSRESSYMIVHFKARYDQIAFRPDDSMLYIYTHTYVTSCIYIYIYTHIHIYIG